MFIKFRVKSQSVYKRPAVYMAAWRCRPTYMYACVSEKRILVISPGVKRHQTRVDWAAWHLPGGPVGPPVRWAATVNVEVGQTTYPVNGGRVGMEGRKESEGQNHKEEREGGSGTIKGAQEHLDREIDGSTWIFVQLLPSS